MTPLISLYTWSSSLIFNLCFPIFLVKNHFYIKRILVPLMRWYSAYPLTINNLEELAAERGIRVRFSNVLIDYLEKWHTPFLIQQQKKWLAGPTPGNWIIKRYPVKSRGQRVYLYTLIDRDNKIIDFVALESRDESIARSFFKKSVNDKGIPIQVEAFISTLLRI